jgi:hypothetical protein
MATVFFRGLVVDVLNNIDGLTNKSIEDYKSLVTSDSLRAFPRNTAIVKDITRGSAKISGRETVCYPFFSSHLSMPLKPGEIVWFVYEDPDNQGELGYWISKVCEPNHVEDVNFSFSSRAYVQNPEAPVKRTSEKFDSPQAESDTVQTYSFKSPTSNPNELVNIINRFTSKIHRFEAVPRYNKRAGDLVIQGSNNSLIMLGEERSPVANDPKVLTNTNSIPPGSGAIDIVVGRGKSPATSSKQIKNELGINENDKRTSNPKEGDPDFPTDAARIYLTANSSSTFETYNPDKLLGITTPSDESLGFPILGSSGSFAVVKADNLRLIAREAGTVRIVKEPAFGKINGAAVLLHGDGTVQISGSRIRLASYNSETGATQPYVRYTELVDFLSSVMQDLQSFCATLVTHVTPGFGAPSPQITAAAQLLQSQIGIKKSALDKGLVGIGSTTIYGE